MWSLTTSIRRACAKRRPFKTRLKLRCILLQDAGRLVRRFTQVFLLFGNAPGIDNGHVRVGADGKDGASAVVDGATGRVDHFQVLLLAVSDSRERIVFQDLEREQACKNRLRPTPEG